METYVIKAPEGFEAVETTVDGVTNISFIPKVVEKKLPTTLEETIPFLPNKLYWLESDGEIVSNYKDVISSDSLEDLNMITSKEYAEAFLALMQLIRFRDIWNEGWIPDWSNSTTQKHTIRIDRGVIIKGISTTISYVLAFKTGVLGDKFLVTFKDLIETAKPIL